MCAVAGRYVVHFDLKVSWKYRKKVSFIARIDCAIDYKFMFSLIAKLS